jgi:hypothetical protein
MIMQEDMHRAIPERKNNSNGFIKVSLCSTLKYEEVSNKPNAKIANRISIRFVAA